MFGYIRPFKPELLVREWESYRGIYCGLCKNLGRYYGWLSRLTLSYDCTFYTMVLMSLRKEKPCYGAGHCVVNPLKKCSFCQNAEESFHQAAALSVLMTCFKLEDDLRDRGKGKIRARLLLPLSRRAQKRAKADFPWMDKIVTETMTAQNQVETEGQKMDACASPTAQMLGKILQHEGGESSSPLSRTLYEFGYFLGRWVYIMDAADDLEKDLESGSFNCLIRESGLTQKAGKEEFDSIRQKANASLNLTLSRLLAAFSLMDWTSFQSILQNIIEKGLPATQKELLFRKEEKE
ncbi:DUF5685 family protein [Caproicibacterium sp. NSD3]